MEGKDVKDTEVFKDEKVESKEACCKACGNPAYPDCKSSCPMFDD